MVEPEPSTSPSPTSPTTCPTGSRPSDRRGGTADILESNRVGGGWRPAYPDGLVGAAHSTRDLRIYRQILTADPRLAT